MSFMFSIVFPCFFMAFHGIFGQMAFVKVTSITMQHEDLAEASSGHTVAVGVNVEMSELKRGMVGSSVEDSPAQEPLGPHKHRLGTVFHSAGVRHFLISHI